MTIVAAGLDGIKNKIEPENSIDKNVYKMSDFERTATEIKSLPSNLEESLDSLKSDSKYLDICFSNGTYRYSCCSQARRYSTDRRRRKHES